MLEEDHKSHDTISCSKYSTFNNRSPYSESGPQYGFHRTMPHTVISGIPKCRCKSCNTNRFRTGSSRPKDTVFPVESKENTDNLTRGECRTPSDSLKFSQGCKSVSYQKVAVTYGHSSPHQSPGRRVEEEEGSSTTSGSYVVDHHDLSDVMNDSHWDITKLPQHSLV